MREFKHDGTSVLVSNMQIEAEQMERFPVLIGNEVTYFHDVRGGFDRPTNNHIVNLVHRVQGHGSPDRVGSAERVEAHLDDSYYYLVVGESRIIDNYPDEDYVLSLLVDEYKFGPQTFSEPLTADIDRRETRYEN